MPASGLVVSEIQGVTVVNFRHTSILESTVVEAIGEELYALVDELARRKIVLDFTPVRFMASQMLGVLIALHKKVTGIKGTVVLCGLRPDLHKVFKISRLDKLLNFAATEDEALDVFNVSDKW